MVVHRRCSDSVAVASWNIGNAPAEMAVWSPAEHILRHMTLFVQVSLTTSDWDECSSWLTALKRLIKARQMLG